MRRRIIRSYLLCVGLSLALSMVLSLLLIAQYGSRGPVFLAQTVFLSFLFCIGVGLYLARLLAESVAHSYSETMRSISEQAAEIAARAARDSVLLDDSTAWEALILPDCPLDFDRDDELAQLSCTFRAMTAYLRQINRLLKRKNSQLQTLLQNMQEGLLHLDDKGRVLLATQQVQILLGESKSDAERLPLKGQNYARLDAALQKRAGQKLPLSFELQTTFPEERILQIYVAALDNRRALLDEAEELLLVLKDITHLKQLESLRRDFVSNVTHELKTPLTSIAGYIELLRAKERDRATQEGFYEIIALESERLMGLIGDLLTLAEIEQKAERLTPDESESCDFGALAVSLCTRLRPLADALNVRLENTVPAGFTLPGNVEQQRHIVSNLLTNGLVYNNSGGFVRLSAGCEGNGRYCRVEDDGIGIPQAEQARVFERFYRVDKARSRGLGGSGLGLAIVKHLSQVLGATLHLRSAEGQGSCFELRYPRA